MDQCTLHRITQVRLYLAVVVLSLTFRCLLGVMGAGATALDLDPPVQGAIAFASVLCDAFSS